MLPRHRSFTPALAVLLLLGCGQSAPEDVAAPPPTALRTDSGLAYRILKRGAGDERPAADSRVAVHYTGWTPDGRQFDSSRGRSAAPVLPLDGVIAGWTEGLQLMSVGDQFRFWIPSELAYGDEPPGDSPAGPLVFDVELVAIQ
jgi:peptidylprolyl isomerase